MRDGDKTGSWDMLIDSILDTTGRSTTARDIPFAYFHRSFRSEPSGAELLAMYNELYEAAKAAVDKFISSHPDHFALHPVDDGDLPISYNLAMTTTGMVIIPRRAEGTMLRRDDGSEIGFVALNGTTLGGTMMVKHQDEWDMLRNNAKLLDNILNAIGIPRDDYASRPHV